MGMADAEIKVRLYALVEIFNLIICAWPLCCLINMLIVILIVFDSGLKLVCVFVCSQKTSFCIRDSDTDIKFLMSYRFLGPVFSERLCIQ